MKALPLVAVGFCAVAALAQFPGTGGGPLGGGSPFPGGSPIPGGRRPQQQTPQDQGKAQGKDSRNSKNAPVAGTTTEGKVRRAVAGQLVIEGDDHRVIWYRLNSRTVLQEGGQDVALARFVPGDHVTVDSTEDDQGFFTAVEVRWETAGTAADRAGATDAWDLPTAASAAPPSSSSGSAPAARRSSDDDERPVLRRKNADAAATAPAAQAPDPAPSPAASSKKNAPAPAADEEPVDNRPTTEIRQAGDSSPDADDPGRPKLKRGAQPAARPTSTTPAQTATAPTPPAASPQTAPPPRSVGAVTPAAPQTRASAPILPQEDPLILKAREVAASYSDSLPNFFAQQMTTRYQSVNPRQGWDALDIVTADVAYQDGKETYKNIKVGNKPVSKSMEDIGGTRSTGEFSSQMEAILRSGAGTIFKRDGEDRIRNRTAIVFKFDIPRERSGWRIEDVSQLYYPAYRGSIWIDKETSRVLRIEQEARNVPRLFPLDTIETSTDYDFVRLSVGNDFLLPVEAEVLSCQRGTNACSRNKIEFRNYRKFGAESEITFGDPSEK